MGTKNIRGGGQELREDEGFGVGKRLIVGIKIYQS